MTDIKKQFGANVKTWRLRRGISQEMLAERASLHRTYVTDVESGTRNLSLETIDRLALALEMSLPALFAGAGELPMLVNDPRRAKGAGRLVDILLVEDNPHDVALTLRAFRKANLKNHVHVVTDGAEALEFLSGSGRHAARKQEPCPHVVLLDLCLPKVSGLEVLRRIKSDSRTQAISVVVLTVSQQDRDIHASRQLGAAAYIVKPVDFDQLTKVALAMNFKWGLLKCSEPASQPNGSAGPVSTGLR